MKPAIVLKPANPTMMHSINLMRRVISKFDITLNQAALLSVLPPASAATGERISPYEVAEITGISRGAVSRLMRSLLDRKLIAQQRSIADMRYVLLKRTAKGDAMLDRINAATAGIPAPKSASEGVKEVFI